MSNMWRPVRGVFGFDSIITKVPTWVKEACTTFFRTAVFPVDSLSANHDLYVLLADLAQEARVTDRSQVATRCMPYRAEVKQCLGDPQHGFNVQQSPDWLKDACTAFFIASDVLGRATPFDDTTHYNQDATSRELNKCTNELYLLLMDIVKGMRGSETIRLQEQCIPYRAEVNRLLAHIEKLAVRRQTEG